MTRLTLRHPVVRLAILALMAALLVAVILTRLASPGTDVVARDSFDRTVGVGWGEAPLGGAWSLSGTKADYRVESNRGIIVVPKAGLTRRATLTQFDERDVEMTFGVRMDRAPAPGGAFVYAILRSVDAQHEFRAKVRLADTGGIYVGATTVVGDEEGDLSPEVRIPDLLYRAGMGLHIRARVEGDPAVVRVKVWPEGTTEPIAWTLRSNARAGLLRASGGIGVQVYVSSTSTNVPVAFTIRGFDARRLVPATGSSQGPGDAGSGATTAPP